MRIGLSALFVRPGRTGGGETYVRGLLAGLQSLNLPHEFVVFLNREAYPTFADLDGSPNFQRVLCSTPLHAYGRHLWEEGRLASLCRSHRVDLLHGLGNVLPSRMPCASAVTIHDLGYKLRDVKLPFMRRHVLGRRITASARRADLVLAVSQTSAAEIVERLRISPDKVRVTLEGPGQELQAVTPWASVREKYGLSRPYFLTIGIEEHKRLDCIIEAAEKLHSESERDVTIVTAGPLGQVPSRHPMLRHLGHVPAEDLACLYKNAVALICFSDLEGFGLPALEAMALGTPVIASDAGAQPEIVGSGGMLVEHGDVEALFRAMLQVISDEVLREDLRRRGRARVADFSWSDCASETVKAYETIRRKRLQASAPSA